MKSQQSIAELKKELAIHEKTVSVIRTKIAKSEAKKSRIQKQLDEITGEKSVVAKAGSRKVKAKTRQKAKRVRGKSGGLTESLVKIFTRAKKPLHIDDILERLIAGGHQTASKNIKKQLGVRLYSNKNNMFVKTGAATFALKAMGAKVSKKVSKKASKTKLKATGKKTKKEALPFPKV